MARYKVVVVNLGYESYHHEQEILAPLNAELVLAPADCLMKMMSFLLPKTPMPF